MNMLHTHCIMWYMFAYTHAPTSLEAFPAFVGVSVAEKMLHTIRAAVLAARVYIYAPYSPHVCTETNHLFYMCMQVYTRTCACMYILAHVHASRYLHMCMHVCTRTCACMSVPTLVHACMYLHMCMHVGTYMCMQVGTYTCVY